MATLSMGRQVNSGVSLALPGRQKKLAVYPDVHRSACHSFATEQAKLRHAMDEDADGYHTPLR